MKAPTLVPSFNKGFLRYIIAFCITVVLAVVLLAAAALLPQDRVMGHMLDSLDLVYYDYVNNCLFDQSYASHMDMVTDILILRTSIGTNSGYLGSILTNPVYTYEGLKEWRDVYDLFASQVYEVPTNGVWFYSRYWMGFRVLVRLALMKLNYGQIKRYLAFAFFSLFMGATCSVAKNTNSKIAFLFAMSVVMVRPYVMATSMQFTCCFLIAFAAMLLIPWIHRRPKYEGLFFMEIGMLTMYFDFYTVPLITMGFPLVYLCVLKQTAGSRISYKTLVRDIAAWFAGYVFMWIAKLTLTTVLTDVNALEQGFRSFAGRVGIHKSASLEKFYSLELAFDRLHRALFSDAGGKKAYLLCAGLILAVVLWKILRGCGSGKSLRSSVPFLLIAGMPIIWFVITKQPIAIHAFFQYRSIALTHWASGMFLYFLLSEKRTPSRCEELPKETV